MISAIERWRRISKIRCAQKYYHVRRWEQAVAERDNMQKEEKETEGFKEKTDQ